MKNIVVNISISLLSLLFTLSILELGARVYKGEFGFHNFLEQKRDLFRSAYPSEFDEELGWIPKKGSHQRNIWNTNVTILNDGIRSNGEIENKEIGDVILAVGDSFTFGDNVSDDETWPARLEEISDTRVINGGVFGYGVDQSYLRMRELVAKYRPTIIIFSLIPDDINRCELSERTGVPKPYFELTRSGELVLMNKHLEAFVLPENSFGIVRKVLGYSFLAHQLMYRTFPEFWLQGSWGSTKAHAKGVEVTCSIFKQLKQYAQLENVKLYILIQYGKDRFEKNLGIVDEVIACIDQRVLRPIDLRTSFAESRKQDIARYEEYFFHGHMTKEGNYFVASVLWETISKGIGATNNIKHQTTQ